MTEHTENRRRSTDSLPRKIVHVWPVIVALFLVAAYYIRNDEKLIRTAQLAEKTADKVSIMEQTLAVQTAMLSEIKDTVKQISRNQARGRGGD